MTQPSLYVWIHKWEFILGQRSNAIIRRSILPRPKQVRFQAVAVDTRNRSDILNNNLLIRLYFIYERSSLERYHKNLAESETKLKTKHNPKIQYNIDNGSPFGELLTIV